MPYKLNNYLRAKRKRAGFTQQELAFLLGSRSGAKVSRLEHKIRTPDLKTAIACRVVFGTPIDDLYPGICNSVKENVIERARLLSRKLGKKGPTPSREQKLTVLLSIVSEGAASAVRDSLWKNKNPTN